MAQSRVKIESWVICDTVKVFELINRGITFCKVMVNVTFIEEKTDNIKECVEESYWEYSINVIVLATWKKKLRKSIMVAR